MTIDKQAHAIQQTREFLADLSLRLDKQEQALIALRGQVTRTRSFWSRLFGQ